MKKIILTIFLLNLVLIIFPKFQDNIYDNSDLSKKIILYKIKNSDYKTTDRGYFIGNDYDLFLIYHRKDLNFINNLVQNKPESRFYALFNMTKQNKKQTLQILSLLYMNDYQKEVEKYFNDNNIDKAILKEICIPPFREKNKQFREAIKEGDFMQYLKRDWESKECSDE